MAFDLSSLTSFLKGENTAAPIKTGVLGIDIGSSAIKIVQLSGVRGTPTLVTYGEILLGPYEGLDLSRTTHLTKHKMIEALVDIVRESEATATSSTFALSYNSTFTTTISVPTLDPKQIGAMIPVEARKYIPAALSRVSLDWFPVSIHEAKKSTRVLISAIYTEALKQYESIILGAGLRIISSEIEIFSSIRSLLSQKDDVVVVIDCGASATHVYIVSRGIIQKTHSVLLSGAGLTSALALSLKVGFREAEEIKRSFGLTGKDGEGLTIQKVLLGEIERGFRELHTVVKRYEEEEKVTATKVIVSGGGALLKGLPTYLEDMFSMPVLLAEPFSKVAYPAYLEDTLKQAGPSFSVAIGVALTAFEKKV